MDARTILIRVDAGPPLAALPDVRPPEVPMATARPVHTETLERLLRGEEPARAEEESEGQPRSFSRRLLRAGLHALWIAIFIGLPVAFVIDLYRQPGPPPAVFTDDDLR